MILYLKLEDVSVVTFINRLITSITPPFSISIICNLFITLSFTDQNRACCIAKVVCLHKRQSSTNSDPIRLFRGPQLLIFNMRQGFPDIGPNHTCCLPRNGNRRGTPTLPLKPFPQTASLWKIWFYK
uniref:Uncharacterized protein n=1 Tax=Opuntia streptacantha TaxID=393608 RepID=A0A7C9A3W7_OPUST